MPVALVKDQEQAAHWKTQIEQCEKEYDRWYKKCEKISKNYRDERGEADDNRRLNLFWANTQTLKPAIYSKTPVPICERRFLDRDTTGRVASTILERCLRYEVSVSLFDRTMRRARNDYLLVGRGQAWIRYTPKFGDPISPKASAEDDITGNAGEPIDEAEVEQTEEQERQLLAESIAVDYVHWQDFYIFPPMARTWDEVEGVGRRLFMSRQDCVDTFGKKIGKAIELDHKPKPQNGQDSPSNVSGQEGLQATVHEIWWRPQKKVIFVAKGYDKLCKEVDDPLHLEKFFPCPEPLYATTTNDTLIPVPDFTESADQYLQIDLLTKRIDILTSSTKVVGVYDSSAQALKRVFQEAAEPNLIPVDSWAMFAEKGGLKGAIDWVPIEMVANVLKILIEVRQQIMQDLDRTTGISDIMRGTSDARETMGAQRLKTNNSATRLQDRQDEMARFCRDVICIMGEIISEHYDPKTLVEVSGALYDEGLDPPDIAPQIANQIPLGMGHNGGPALVPSQDANPAMMAPQAGEQAVPAGQPMPGQPPAPSMALQEPSEQKEQRKLGMIANAIELLRSDKLRGFRIDIETDSTVQGDAQQEKEQRIAFVEGVTKFIETAAQVTMVTPEFAPLAAKMLGFAVRGFRVGRDLESAIEDFCDKAEMDAKRAALQPKAPSPDQIKADAEKAKSAAEMQQVQLQGQLDMAQQKLQAGIDEHKGQLELQKLGFEVRMKEMEVEIAKIKAQADLAKVGHDRHKMDTEAAISSADLDKQVMERQNHHKTIVNAEIEPVKNVLGQIVQHLGEHAQHLKALHEQNSAPIEFSYGHDGKLAGVKKGNIERRINRGQNGKPMGLQ